MPAIYFVQPTKENVDLIVADLRDHKYSATTICFSTTVSDDLLHYLADNASISNVANLIESVQDMYINYEVLEDQLFSIGIDRAYQLFNDSHTGEQEAMELINYVVDSLMSVCITLKEVPIIRARSGSLEDAIAARLTQKLNSFNAQHPSFFQRGVSTRPILLITNRNHDISAGLLHGWNYQALIKEVTEYRMNRVMVNGKWEDIEPDSELWRDCKSAIIPDVTDRIQAKTKELVAEKERFQVVANSFGLSFDKDAEVSLNDDDKKFAMHPCTTHRQAASGSRDGKVRRADEHHPTAEEGDRPPHVTGESGR